MLKNILQIKLKILSRLILEKYKPEIIGITGSVGKTSTSGAIHTVLSTKYNVRQSFENYNNEIGLPLTVIGSNSPGRSFVGWMKIFLKALKLYLVKDQNYPRILILEMGVDRPGDLDYLKTIAKPKIGVITLIGSAHLEHFGTMDKIEKEKSSIIKNLPAEGWAVLNYDDERIRSVSRNSKNKTITFGFDEKSDVRARELIFSFEESKEIDNLVGISFKLSYKGSTVPVLLPQVIGYAAIYAALAAAAVALTYDFNLVEISQALRKLELPKGRMNLIHGIKNTMIVDDSYNASPQSALLALSMVGKIPLVRSAKRFAVLGDMNELGSYSEQGHREVGQAVIDNKIDILIAVGERARDIARGALAAGLKEDRIYYFPNADDARIFVQDRIKEGDLIFIKGSQVMRMEKIVKEIMAEPLRAQELLVRQDWEDA